MPVDDYGYTHSMGNPARFRVVFDEDIKDNLCYVVVDMEKMEVVNKFSNLDIARDQAKKLTQMRSTDG